MDILFKGVQVTVEQFFKEEIRQKAILSVPELHLTGPTAVIGANGSGKSTLVKLINGLRSTSTGEVTVNGLSTKKSIKEIRKQVGFIFTDASNQIIMPTPIEDMALSLKGRTATAEVSAVALAKLTEFGLEELAYTPISMLSAGQMQLLAFAVVLAIEPKVLVCDEPTTLLDLFWRNKISELILSQETPSIVSTHDLDLAKRFDKTVLVAGGEVVFYGDSAEAVSQYRDLIARAN